MDMFNSVLVLVTSLLFTVTEAVYFTQRQFTFCLPSDLSKGTILGRVFAYTNIGDNCTNKILIYDVIGEATGIAVNDSGWISIEDVSILNTTGSIFVNISATCGSENSDARIAFTSVNITTVPIESKSVNQNDLDPGDLNRLCFDGLPSSFYVEENVKDIVTGRLSDCYLSNGITRTYRITRPKNRFTVNQATSEISVVKPFNRESLVVADANGQKDNITGIQQIRIVCQLTYNGNVQNVQRRFMNVTVLDVNDNPPTFADYNDVQTYQTDIVVTPDETNYNIDEVLVDSDTCKESVHVIKVVRDPLQLCKPSLNCYNTHLGKTICRLLVTLEKTELINDTLYRCEIEVVDTQLIPSSNMLPSATLVINVHKQQEGVAVVQSLKTTRTLTFYRNATRLARLLKMDRQQRGRSDSRFSLEDKIFEITRQDGIVYVSNVDALSAADDTVSLRVVQSDGIAINIIVNMVGTARTAHTQDDCEESCSTYYSDELCIGSCGIGLLDGGCVMRGSDIYDKMNSSYGTCTYDTKYCPDRICDELELEHPWLCPQDCSRKVTGPALKNQQSGMGIVKAKGPCWCESDDYDYLDNVYDADIICQCAPRLVPKIASIDDLATSTSTSLEKKYQASIISYDFPDIASTTTVPPFTPRSDNGTNHSEMVALTTEESHSSCDNACRTAIGLGLGAFVTIAFSLFMLWFTKRRNDRRKNNLKHVGSVVSMSAIPSDYIEDRERRLSYSSPQWSPKGPIYMSQIRDRNDHSKWEIPRENLTLDNTLGEGEFGLVVKAKAVGIDGDESVKEVAVKMLKHCSTQLEEQDLWSEFNLLTDVSHPNVIRLLGACTSDGPFYVIVEYCEHGCLLKYLRRSRLEENGYVNTRIRFKSPNPKDQLDPNREGDLLSVRDLLSFAWQIAKGMSYLSEIKLVHRDLAARNVLVATGKVLKISDFGLTRDVYEADTYLKKSRGRIPVKWLAPESLYAQIYTTRSDVWSYGIVLWEIVTLGAPPYPGIPPERLYNLLIGGYRMDRPENCSDEMYAVMQKCWKIDAQERPPFARLAMIFDRILQEKTGYLDLSRLGGNVPDLYSKCFDADILETNVNDHTTTDVEIPMPTDTAADAIDTMNITTVCNETYTTDTYLTPLCNTQSNNANNDKAIPLQELRVHSNMEEQLRPICEKVSDKTADTGDALFRRNIPELIVQNSSKCYKNKNVIYPSENLSLLMDNGTARFVNNTEIGND